MYAVALDILFSVVCCVVEKEATHTRDTLEDLYFGNITPNEQDITPGSVLADAMDRAEQCEEKLTALLEGEEKTLLLRLLNAENEICSTMALENFILGFRLGMRIAIESLDEDDGNMIYEVKFRDTAGAEYEADLDAFTGEILKWEKD